MLKNFFVLALFFFITILTQHEVKNYTLREFVVASDQELMQHKKKLDSLIKEKKVTIPQSQAIFFYPNPIEHKERLIKDTLQYQPMNAKDYEMFDRILKSEVDANAKGYLVLNHAANNAYGQMYVNDRLQRLALELQGVPVRHSKGFLFRDISNRTNLTTEKQKRKTFLGKGVGRSDWDHKDDLLSCNPGITGNTLKSTESSLNFYLVGQRRMKPDVTIIPCVADKPLSTAIVNELSTAIKNFEEKNPRGIWMQIILKNKKDARKVLYNSWEFGKLRAPIVGDKTVSNSVKVMQAIQKKPDQIEDLGHQQMRIVLTPDKFLDLTNPNIEVKAFSPEEEFLQEFHNEVETVVDQIRINEWKSLTLPQKLKRYIMNIPKKHAGVWQKKQIKKESQHWFIAQ